MTRLVSGVFLAVVALALIWYLTSIALLGVALIVAAMAFHEYDRIVDKIGAKVPYWTALVATLLVCAMVPFEWVEIESVLAGALLLIALNVLASPRVGAPLLADTAAAVLAPVYIGMPLGCLVGVHAIAGREAVLLLIATVAVSDTAQYYTGRTLGRTPLAPLRSPKKTREGAVGGFVIAPAFLAIAGAYWLPDYPWYWHLSLGFGIVVAGIIGDLFESMLKRAADMKDSGALIPGHGGVLDRIDALLFAAPVFYFFLRNI
ncbi:MAG TPA: phosphatidate cytidylyltransferase [Vicinamibacterales bacterium]|nr:phosphatidate cytidylyltransferase [Vicinamibacterales bacterium]